jgi:hypothetical protein
VLSGLRLSGILSRLRGTAILLASRGGGFVGLWVWVASESVWNSAALQVGIAED